MLSPSDVIRTAVDADGNSYVVGSVTMPFPAMVFREGPMRSSASTTRSERRCGMASLALL